MGLTQTSVAFTPNNEVLLSKWKLNLPLQKCSVKIQQRNDFETLPGFAVRKIKWNYIQAYRALVALPYTQKMYLNLGMRKKPTLKKQKWSLCIC